MACLRFDFRFPIPNRDFRFELTWHVSDSNSRFRFRGSKILRFRDFCDFASPQFHDFAILISRFRFGSAPSLLPELRPYTVRPAEHGNSRGPMAFHMRKCTLGVRVGTSLLLLWLLHLGLGHMYSHELFNARRMTSAASDRNPVDMKNYSIESWLVREFLKC